MHANYQLNPVRTAAGS